MNTTLSVLKRTANRKPVSLAIFVLLGIVAAVGIPQAAAQGAEPATASTYELIAVLGAIAGGVVRTTIPYLRKRKEREEAIVAGTKDESGNQLTQLKFGSSFLYTFVLSVVVSTASALVFLPNALATIPSGASVLVALTYAFTFAYTANDVVNEMKA